ncbi:39S ribosomal protein L47, mitochondrial [Ascosphaera aggregata]|nr:39S ribosomal protein L47, mitochondrial [Ascosphaera aggregata]
MSFLTVGTAPIRSALACELPPAFLAPSLFSSKLISGSQQQQQQTSAFSTTSTNCARNKRRGVSAIHRTGLNVPLHASKFGLPVPIKPDEHKQQVEATPNHGLWGFFVPERERVPSVDYEADCGRSWTIQELRNKSFDELHCLWWVCAKERNRIATSDIERKRLALGYGVVEATQRRRIVLRTQKAIKSVLLERWYAWEDGRNAWVAGYRPDEEGYYEK